MKKFRKGEQIKTISELEEVLRTDNWVYLRDRPKHAGFIQSMMLMTVSRLLHTGQFFKAIRNEEGDL